MSNKKDRTRCIKTLSPTSLTWLGEFLQLSQKIMHELFASVLVQDGWNLQGTLKAQSTQHENFYEN